MISFKDFLQSLNESSEVDKLDHLEHVEDHIIHSGHIGVEHAARTLMAIRDKLNGEDSKVKLSTKYDGAPSLVFGINPENNKYFVASKSAFNATPKLNYSHEDIENNHRSSPGLQRKLKVAFDNLKNILPKSGVYQGDMMYSKDDLIDKDDNYSFTPNTIQYSTPKNSEEGKKINQAKIGIVIHTKYHGDTISKMKAGWDVDHKQFKEHPEVHVINPELDNLKTLSDSDNGKFNDHLESARKHYAKAKDEAFASLELTYPYIKSYINNAVRQGTQPTTDDLNDYLNTKFDDEVESLKTPAGRESRRKKNREILDAINVNKKSYDSIFDMHKSLQDAKGVLIKHLNKNASPYKHTIGDEKTNPEGYVAVKYGVGPKSIQTQMPSKLVDRSDFSKKNFANAKFVKTKNPIVMAYGRMNPPTLGHRILADRVKEEADKRGCGHVVVLSHTTGDTSNPLSPEEKLAHAKRFMPQTTLKLSDPKSPSFIQQARDLNKAGHDELVMVAGADRVADFKKALESQNGKDYNFKRITVVSAGERDADSVGVEGISSTKMREFAKKDDWASFKKASPPDVSESHVRALYDSLQKSLKINNEKNQAKKDSSKKTVKKVKKSLKEEGGAGEVGTNKLVDRYLIDTPGQPNRISIINKIMKGRKK